VPKEEERRGEVGGDACEKTETLLRKLFLTKKEGGRANPGPRKGIRSESLKKEGGQEFMEICIARSEKEQILDG